MNFLDSSRAMFWLTRDFINLINERFLGRRIEKWIIAKDILLFKDIWMRWYVEFSNKDAIDAIFGKENRKMNVWW